MNMRTELANVTNLSMYVSFQVTTVKNIFSADVLPVVSFIHSDLLKQSVMLGPEHLLIKVQ